MKTRRLWWPRIPPSWRMNPDNLAVCQDGVEYHSFGAIRYYQEVGIWNCD